MSSLQEQFNDSQALSRLARQNNNKLNEISVVTSPGARAAAWAVEIKSNVEYNVYKVRQVIIGDAGSIPVEIGAETEATNLGESPLDPGQLSAGINAIMFRIGDKNAIYVQV